MSNFFNPWFDPVEIKEQSIDTWSISLHSHTPYPYPPQELSTTRVPPWQHKEQEYRVAGHPITSNNDKELGFGAVSPRIRVPGWYRDSEEQADVYGSSWCNALADLTSYAQFGGIGTKCEPEDSRYPPIQYKIGKNYQWCGNRRTNWTESDADSTELGTPALTIASTLASSRSDQNREISLETYSRRPSRDASCQHEVSSKTLPSVRSLLSGLRNLSPPAKNPTVPWTGPQIEPLELKLGTQNDTPGAFTASHDEDDNESLASSWATSESSEYTYLETSEVSNDASHIHEVSTRQTGVQVGYARLHIRVEILSLSRLPNGEGESDHWCEERDCDGFNHDTSDEDDNGDDYDGAGLFINKVDAPNDNDGEGHARYQTGSRASIHPPERSSTNRLSGRRKRRMDQNDDQENDEDDDRRKRSRRRSNSPGLAAVQNIPRFACPYQAYEALLDCLRRGPRNPKGGCEGISRLKQHLHRRHVLSSRCQRCWVSFDKKSKLEEHVHQANCHEIPKPDSERFMGVENEVLVDRTNGALPEDTWWALFQVLIPGMRARPTEELKTLYSPYYLCIPSDMSFTFPGLGLNLSSISFPDTMQGQNPGLDRNQLTMESQIISVPIFENFHPLNNYIALPQSQQNSQAHVSPVELQVTSTVPNISAPSPRPSAAPQSLLTDSVSSSVSNMNRSDSSIGTTPNTSPNTTPTSTGTCTTSTTTGSNGIITTQLRRNFQRLQAKNQRAETTITSLRETNRATQEGVSRADAILEEIFALEQDEDIVIPAAIYDKLAQMSEIFVGIGERLR